MEVPTELKNLYQHWEEHSKISLNQSNKLEGNAIFSAIKSFISERMRIWEKKSSGESPPFTKDLILQKFRFCNIYRELDKQTIQIHQSLQEYKDDFDLWLLNLVFQRFVAKPETVEKVGFLNFEDKNNTRVYQSLVDLPSPKFGSAYVFPISIIQKSEFNTRELFFTKYLPKRIKEVSNLVKGFENISVNKALELILPKFGFSFKFHWTEVLIDVAYQFPVSINLFEDFYVGPGAKPTLKMFQEKITLEDLVVSNLDNFPFLEFKGVRIPLSAENWEGICCEYRKYKNLKAGNGRRRYFV